MVRGSPVLIRDVVWVRDGSPSRKNVGRSKKQRRAMRARPRRSAHADFACSRPLRWRDCTKARSTAFIRF
jgi:hypothetical protein